jgi:HD-like signal output (HDOD) protein
MVANSQHINKSTLAKYEILKGLSDESLEELAAKTVYVRFPEKRKIVSAGSSDQWLYFLLEGSVELVTFAGKRTKISDNIPEGKSPLAAETPRKVSVVTTKPTSFFRIDSNLLALMKKRKAEDDTQAQADYEVGEINEEGDTESKLFLAFYHDFMNDRMELPSLPDIAFRVGKAIKNPENDITGISKIIQTDAALTARLIQVANSPLYRGTTDVTTCRMAISRLGMNATRNLTYSFAMKQLFKTKSPTLKNFMVSIWRHSSRVAAISALISRHVPRMDADQALLAGLVHDIGSLPIIAHCKQYPEVLEDPKELHRIIRNLRPQIGAMILRKWKFPSDIVNAALEADNWRRDGSNAIDLADVVITAQVHSYFGSPAYDKLPPLSHIKPFTKISIAGGLTPEKSLEILEASKEEIQQMMQLLGGNSA